MNRRRLGSHLRIAIVLGLLPMTAGGCGFIFSHGPPVGHEQMEFFTCTESNTGPIVDVIWAGLNVLVALAAGVAYENSGSVVAVGLLWSGISGGAAIVGFDKSEKCEASKLALAQRERARGPGARRRPVAVDATVQAVVVTPAVDTLTVGERVQLVATARSSSGAVIPNKMFRWSSSNDAIASVSNAGLVTAHATGSVVIAANTDNVVGIAHLRVSPQIER